MKVLKIVEGYDGKYTSNVKEIVIKDLPLNFRLKELLKILEIKKDILLLLPSLVSPFRTMQELDMGTKKLK